MSASDLAPRHYDYDCRTEDGYDPTTWTIRAGEAPAAASQRESSSEAARRLGVREMSLRSKARELGYDLAKGEGGAAALLPSLSWDLAASRMVIGPGGPSKGFRDLLLAPGLETCATAARRLGKRAEALRENAIALGWSTGEGLTPPQWDMAAARIRVRARRVA